MEDEESTSPFSKVALEARAVSLGSLGLACSLPLLKDSDSVAQGSSLVTQRAVCVVIAWSSSRLPVESAAEEAAQILILQPLVLLE